MSPSIHEYWDGFIGIAPYTADLPNKKQNFLYQLKDQGILDHITVSFFIKTARGDYASAIKFGSYDHSGIDPGQTL